MRMDRNNIRESRQISVAVVPGLAGGTMQMGRLTRAMRRAGFTVVKNPAEADVVLAHSAGCYGLPAIQSHQKLILVNPPYWPGKTVGERGKKRLRTLLYYRKYNYKMFDWMQKNAWGIFYVLRDQERTRQIFRTADQFDLPTVISGHPVVLVRNDDDDWLTNDLDELQVAHSRLRIERLPGDHDDLLVNPGPYVSLVHSLFAEDTTLVRMTSYGLHPKYTPTLYNHGMHDYWQRQQPGRPLFPDLLWSRPENRLYAGKLLIVGGNAHGFAAPAEAYVEAEKAGIGVARVLLPDALRRTVGKVFAAGEYAPSTPSGSFSQKALAELMSMAQWADGVLIGGDLGRNSETAILLEKFVEKYDGQLTLSSDGADYFINPQTTILSRPDTLLVLSFSQLQKLATHAKFTTPFTSSMDFLHLVSALHEFTTAHRINLIIDHPDNTIVAVNGQITTTKVATQATTSTASTTRLAAYATVWWLQHPGRAYEALVTGVSLL